MRIQVLEASTSALRWVLVAGVEEHWRTGSKAQVRALLILDSTQPDPWMCGYNAKLMPTEHDGHPSSTVYGSLDGFRWQVEMIEGISIRPRRKRITMTKPLKPLTAWDVFRLFAELPDDMFADIGELQPNEHRPGLCDDEQWEQQAPEEPTEVDKDPDPSPQ
jgi:hypothetical protein